MAKASKDIKITKELATCLSGARGFDPSAKTLPLAQVKRMLVATKKFREKSADDLLTNWSRHGHYVAYLTRLEADTKELRNDFKNLDTSLFEGNPFFQFVDVASINIMKNTLFKKMKAIIAADKIELRRADVASHLIAKYSQK